MMTERFTWLKIRDRTTFLRLTGVLFLVYLANGLWSPLLAVYMGSLGAETSQIGLVLATFQAANLASQYWWGRLSDRLGRRKPLLLLGTAGLGIAYLGVAGADQYGWLFAGRALEGVALAAYSTGSLALIGDLLEDQAGRGRLMGIYRTFGSLAFSISALTGGWLADTFSLRVPFVIAACCFMLACGLGARIEERPAVESDGDAGPHPPAVPPLDSNLTLAGDRRARRALWSFLALLFTWMFAMGAVVSLWPVYMSSVGYSKTAIGGLWALAALCEVPLMIMAGQLSDRWGRKRVMLTGFTGMSLAFLAYTLSPIFAWVVGVQVLRAIAYSCFETPALLYATELGLRRQRGRLAGLYYSSGSFGAIAGSIAGGVVAQQFGLALMFQSVVALMLAVALVMSRLMPRLRPAQPDALERPLAARTPEPES